MDIHNNPLKSSHPIEHKDVGVFILFEVILITFAVVAALVVIFFFRPDVQTRESKVNTADQNMSLSCDNNIIFDNHKEKYDGGRKGFSTVELL